MRRGVKVGVPIFLICLIAGYGFTAFLIASGVTKAERKSQEDHPAAYGLEFQEVQFVSRKGDVMLSGWYLPGRGSKPTLIFVHGIGGVRSGDKAVDLASRLVSRGFNVLLFDLRGHGSSGGDRIGGGYLERWDLLGAFDFLVAQGTPPERIGVVGFSMGAGTSILGVAQEPGIRALVADSPYANVSDLITREVARKTVFPEWSVPIFLPGTKLVAKLVHQIDLGALVPEKAVRRLGYPILLIHGTADTRIPVGQGVRVHQAAHPDSTIWLVPEVDHVDSFSTHPDEYVARVGEYFTRRLSAP
jgi:dipeptidyl aminopeptidase/acylaminoacyl peptidase